MSSPSGPSWLPDRYKFSGTLLGGGQGAVYICDDKILSRPVAVKAFHDVTNIAALKKEIEGRSKIKSKHVAEVYECLFEDGQPVALVMEFVPGESLGDASIIPTTLDGRLRLLYQISSGIADIHDANVIHRDIKPLNMKVDGSGILKIFDLGISNLDASDASTVGGAGTYVFAAPEVYAAPISLTPAVDVYAIGVLGWYLLAGMFPPALAEIPPQSGANVLPPLSSAVQGLTVVTTFLDRALSVSPSDRPSASEIREALGSWLTHAQRRAVFSGPGITQVLDKMGTAVRIEIKPHGDIRVAYLGGRFVIRETNGDVYVNNLPATVDAALPNSCVITFGAPPAGATRRFLSFNVSQPEIVL